MIRSIRFTQLALLVACFCPSVDAAEPDSSGDRLGKKIETNFQSLDGKKVALADVKGKSATVVVFLSFDCPNSNGYSSTLISLHREFSEKKVNFLGVCENESAVDEIRKKVAEYRLPFSVVADPDHAIADAFKASVTPEAFVLDHNLVVRYRGRIDNMYSARLRRNNEVTEHDLRNALTDVTAGKPVRTPVTAAIGCTIGGRRSAATVATKLTYHRDIVPILQANCQGCHRPGEVGPFSLMTYKQAVTWAEDIKEFTANRRMPPWKPVDGVPFHNDRRLADADIKKLAEWVDGGTPEGDPTAAPKPPGFTDGWMLGKPDLILNTGDDFVLGPSGSDTFRMYVLPTKLDADQYIVGFEVKPGNPRIVHHTLNYWDITGKGRELELKAKDKAAATDRDRGPGYSAAMGVGFIPTSSPRSGVPPIGNFGGWAPGQLPRMLPEGTGYLLPKGADVLLQVHYHRNGKEERDRTQIGLYFAKKPVDRPFSTVMAGPRGFMLIPPDKSDHRVEGSVYLHTEAVLHSVMPHMHLIGKSVKVTMTIPGEKPRVLVDIKEWDYNWQETYWLKDPMKVPAGTRFEIVGVYDNSSSNPNNPRHPPGWVMFGEQTTNEMLFGFFGLTSVEAGKRVYARSAPPKLENK